MQYAIIILCALLYDLCAGVHTVALARRRIVLAVWTGTLLPPLGWVSFFFMIDATSRLEQCLILACNSVAIAVGVLLTLKLTKRKKVGAAKLRRPKVAHHQLAGVCPHEEIKA